AGLLRAAVLGVELRRGHDRMAGRGVPAAGRADMASGSSVKELVVERFRAFRARTRTKAKYRGLSTARRTMMPFVASVEMTFSSPGVPVEMTFSSPGAPVEMTFSWNLGFYWESWAGVLGCSSLRLNEQADAQDAE